MVKRTLLQDSMVDDMGDADNQLTSLLPASQKAAVDPTIVNALKQQILAQNTSSKWQGGVDAETAANDMAKIMAGIGVTDIRQFGIIEQVAAEEVKQDGKGGYVDQQGRPVDSSIVTPQSYQTEGGEISYYTAPIGKIQNFGNKTTGQLVPNTYGERQGGNAFGGTYEGEGNTGYRVDFTPDGTPIFYTTGASSSDVQDWMPLLQLGLAVTGAGGLLGNALLGGGSQVASSMLGNAILGGVTTGIAGGDILKGALTAGAAAGITPATEMVLGNIPNFNSLPSSVKAAVTSAVSGTIMNGGEITPTVLASALAAGLGAASKDADLAKFESERTESGFAGQTSLTEEEMRNLGIISDANLPTGTQLASANTGTMTDAGTGLNVTTVPTTGIDFNSAVNSNQILEDANLFRTNVNTIPSPVQLAEGETITGSRVDSQGQSRLTITRANPLDPSSPTIYDAVVSPDNLSVTYEWGGVDVDDQGNVIGSGTTVSSRSKPSWTTLPITGNANTGITDTTKTLTLDDITNIISNANIGNQSNASTNTTVQLTPEQIATNAGFPSLGAYTMFNGNFDAYNTAKGLGETALKMGVGSLEKDMRYDVNNDGKITSLDALMLSKGTPLLTEAATQTGTQTVTQPSNQTATQQTNQTVSNAGSTLTADDVTRIIGGQNLATTQDVQTAIGNINIPQGLTTADVQSIVSTALANNPSLTTADVQSIVNTAVSNIPSGLTSTEVQTIVSNVFASNPSLTSQQVTSIVDNAISKLPANLTAQNVVDIIADQGLATSTQLANQSANTETAFNTALTNQANQFNTSLAQTQSTITDLANNLGVTRDELLSQLGLTEEGLQQRITDLQTEYGSQLGNVESNLNTQISNIQTNLNDQLSSLNSSNASSFGAILAAIQAMQAIQQSNQPRTYTYQLADPSTWGSPVYNQTTGPVTPITPLDFGTRDLLKDTQWEKFLDPNYGKVPQPVQFNQPSNMSYNELMNVLGTGQDVSPSQPLSINDVISGIQNQYGQAPQGTMG